MACELSLKIFLGYASFLSHRLASVLRAEVKKEMPIHASNLKVLAGEDVEDDAGDGVTVDVEPVAAAAVMGVELSLI